MLDATSGPACHTYDLASVLVVGCGNMGAALASGFKRTADACWVMAVDPATKRARSLLGDARVGLAASLDAIGDFSPQLVILAVKPQQIAFEGSQIALLNKGEPTIVSIAAGVSIAGLRTIFGQSACLARAMPNTPASLGEGATALFADRLLAPKRRAAVERFFESVGIISWLAREDDLDVVTALSGSGPAYIFAMAEQLGLAAGHLGLPGQIADRFARQTVVGAAAMLARTEERPEKLRQAVTSPGGTTEAALAILSASGGLPDLLERTLRAALNRSRELGRATSVEPDANSVQSNGTQHPGTTVPD